MKNKFALYFFLTLSFCFVLSAEEIQDIRFMLIPLESESRYDDDVTSALENALGRISRFTLVDRKHLEQIIQEQRFQLTGFVNDQTIIELGEMVGANKAINGSYTLNFERINTDNGSYTLAELELFLKIVDLKTGKVDIAFPDIRVSGSDSENNRDRAFMDALHRATIRFDQEIRSLYSLKSSIYRIEDGIVIIKIDENPGIQKGQYYSVVENIYLYDDITGENILFSQDEKGILKIDRITDSFAFASIIRGVHHIEEGMVIQESPHYREKILNAGLSFDSSKVAGHYIPGFSITSKTSLGKRFYLDSGIGMLFDNFVSTLDFYIIPGLQITLVPEVLKFSAGGRVGLMLAFQEGKNLDIFIDENNYNASQGFPTGTSLELGAEAGLDISLPQDMELFIKAGYLYTPPIDKWEITEDKDDDPDRWAIPAPYLEQAIFDASGFQVKAGIRIYL